MTSLLPTRVLLITLNLEYRGLTTQLRLLAGNLPRDRFAVEVIALGLSGPVGNELKAAAPVQALNWTRSFDPGALLRLRMLMKTFRPHLIHTWGLESLRAALALKPYRVPILADYIRCPLRVGRLQSTFLRWSLNQASKVIARGSFEAETYQRLGVSPTQVEIISPGVEINDSSSVSTNIKQTLRSLLVVGPVEARKGFRDAVWTFDILRYLYDDLRLVVIGTGSDWTRLREFARNVRAIGSVEFVEHCPTVSTWLSEAPVMWLPGRSGGRIVALEAMAAGCPVIGSQRPDLADIIQDGVNGILLPAHDRVAWARQTRRLLDHPELAKSLGRAGRKSVAENFSLHTMVRRFTELYERLGQKAKHVKQAA
jgi:glycosyltransferase involved in cell wall biosynthesis